MKRVLVLVLLSIVFTAVYADLIITRNESGQISKEIYANGCFAEVINDRVMSVWDFRNMTLSLYNYDLKIYTNIAYDKFKEEMDRQTKAEIDNELKNLPPERRKVYIEATRKLYSRLIPRLEVVDTTNICGYPSIQFRVLNDTLLAQRIWISKKLREDIGKEIPFGSMKKVESIFKGNRKMKVDAMNIPIDGVTMLAERIENEGYVMKRYDYGIRTKSNPAIYSKIEAVDNCISSVSKMKVDMKIFNAPSGFKKLSYSEYQIQLIKYMENQ
jgi:hypothetical protein